MTRGEFKTKIINLLNYYGFKIEDDSKATSFSVLKRDITIRTQGEATIINGQIMQQPGKIGDITLKALISSGVGEINDCNEIKTPMFGIHMQAIFKDVVFKESHSMIEIGDISGVEQEIQNFIHMFGM